MDIDDINIDFQEQDIKMVFDSFDGNKSPGSDGLPIEFYKCFWENIKPYVLNSYKCMLIKGELGISQKQGVISLIPKKDKDPARIKN